MGAKIMKSIPEHAPAFLMEWQTSLELAAAGIDMRPRIRVIGQDDAVITLPRDEWRLGRTLAAASPFAMARMARTIIVSSAGDGAFETWMLSQAVVAGLMTTFHWSDTFKVVSTIELKDIAQAPPLAQRFAWVCLDEPRELDAVAVALAESVFTAGGLCPAHLISCAGYEAGAA